MTEQGLQKMYVKQRIAKRVISRFIVKRWQFTFRPIRHGSSFDVELEFSTAIDLLRDIEIPLKLSNADWGLEP